MRELEKKFSGKHVVFIAQVRRRMMRWSAGLQSGSAQSTCLWDCRRDVVAVAPCMNEVELFLHGLLQIHSLCGKHIVL